MAGKQDIDLTVKVGHRGGFSKHKATRNFHRCQGRHSGTVTKEGPTGKAETHGLFRNRKPCGESPPVFWEVAGLFLTSTVDHENGWLPAVFSQIGRVPAKVEVNVQHEVILVRVSDAVLSEHGALVNENVR